MKHLLLILTLAGSSAHADWLFSIDKRKVADGHRNHPGTLEKEFMAYDMPCDSQEGYVLNRSQTPVVLDFDYPSLVRKGQVVNRGPKILFYRVTNWGLPGDWETVYYSVSPNSSVEVDLSGAKQIWSWSEAGQTPVPALVGCFATDQHAWVATITKTPTPTVTPTATPTWTPTITPSVTKTVTPTWTPTVTPSITQTHTPTITPTVTATNTPG